MTFFQKIRHYALALGFDACGISRVAAVSDAERYTRWLEENSQTDMTYMAQYVDKRLDPRLLVEGTRSVISVALNYYPCKKLPADVPQFAYYAYGNDYHSVIREKLRRLLKYIKLSNPFAAGRCFSDSAPVLEHFWAARSGLGFIGKNTLLIIPDKGSYFFLGELMLNLEPDCNDTPLTASCGTCRRCIDACPTGALERPYYLNANKCISYQTIENRGKISPCIIPLLSNNVFGCDICQKVCPWNRFAQPHDNPELTPSEEFLSLDLKKLAAMDEEDFQRLFGQSAVQRLGLSRLKRNVAAISETPDK
ncbi:MAG: tRNA epoxyqueuosine(34) reductase QueG [Proteiniphilum sp.]|jgi:epoxyqueuosine reductase|nr:tRNA epoxyqueuosine(34) reductase QueG [Proteiniphilum sp.]